MIHMEICIGNTKYFSACYKQIIIPPLKRQFAQSKNNFLSGQGSSLKYKKGLLHNLTIFMHILAIYLFFGGWGVGGLLGGGRAGTTIQKKKNKMKDTITITSAWMQDFRSSI